jgi:hypothetical protein
VSAAFASWTASDANAFIAAFTDAGLLDLFGEEGQTADEVKTDLPNYIGSEPISNEEFVETSVDGDNATVEVQYAVGSTMEKSEFALVQADGAWKVDGEEVLVPDVPEGTTLVHVDLNEFAFGFNRNDIGDGNVAFEASNVGEQTHELALVQLSGDITVEQTVEQFLASETGEVPGVTFIGQTEAEPGETSNLVLVEPLEPGRYAFICLFPDTNEGEDGTPHAEKGMAEEFVVE